MEAPNRNAAAADSTPASSAINETPVAKTESDGDVVFYMEEPRAGNYPRLIILSHFLILIIMYIILIIILCTFIRIILFRFSSLMFIYFITFPYFHLGFFHFNLIIVNFLFIFILIFCSFINKPIFNFISFYHESLSELSHLHFVYDHRSSASCTIPSRHKTNRDQT